MLAEATRSVFVVFRSPPRSPSVVLVKQDGEVVLPAPPAAAAPMATPPAVVLQPFYPEISNTFTLSLWLNPTTTIDLPNETNRGLEKMKRQHLVIFPEQGELSIGPGHACAGISAGVNGVCVLEHSARYRPVLLVCPQKLEGWTHLAVVYRNKQPHLYLNGKLARSGLTSTMVVHPGGQPAKGTASFQDGIADVRILNRALSDQEIVDLFANGRAGQQKPRPPGCPIELGISNHGTITATVSANGNYELQLTQGEPIKLSVRDIPEPLLVNGPWELRFPSGWGAPERITLDKLISWTDRAEAGVKYFSGTAIYSCKFQISDLRSQIFLDLGTVKYLAEVKVNDKAIGVLWKPPFQVEITDAVKPGSNVLEIKVTNLWPNRLIGDEQEPSDMEWNGQGGMSKWPEWFIAGKPRPSRERYTFTTWQHYTKGSPLLPSGLLGPVTLWSAKQIRR